MSIRKLLSCLLLFFLLIMPDICFSSAPGIPPEISQLNNPRYRVGCDTGGPMRNKALKYFPNAQILSYNSLLDAYYALKTGKIDALVCDESEMIAVMRGEINDAKFLPGYLGEPVSIAAGLSDYSKIPGLKEKFNAFIAKIKADGTLDDMLKRWVYDGNTDMPDINVPEKSDIHLIVGTTGLVIPFSFYISKDVTGFDIELARRFAAHIGATLEFKISDFGGILMFIHEGMADIALSSLYYSPERSENITFSDIIYTVNSAVVVRDESNTRNPAIMASGENMRDDSVSDDGNAQAPGKFSAFRGKRIGVATGSVHYDMVKKAIPDAEISYFDTLANIINAVEANKIDAFALDEPVVINIEREKPNITHTDESLGNIDNAFIFAKNDHGNKLRDEFNEFMSRIKSDGTLKEIRSIWFGEDDSKKIAADYEKFTDKNGIIHIALNPEDPPFSYMQDNRLTGYDVDIILRFCAEKSYRPEFSGMNFAGIIPAVNSGKYDIGMGGITITPERAESVNFSSPVYTGTARLMILKTEQNDKDTGMRKSQERIPKYKTLHELDGKTIGIQTGVDGWEKIARKILPNSKIVFYNTFADLAAALKSHKIEAFFADEPVYNLMAAEDNNLAKIDEKIDDYYSIAYGFPKNEKGRKLCDEINEYIRRIKANGELDAIISKWEGADESAKTLPDYKNFPAPKGILSIATEGEYAPFNYYRGNEIAGFEIDIAARFCEANGYGLKITSMILDSVVPAIVSGKYDFAAAALAPNDEHSKEIIFSEPYSKSRSVMVCLKAEDSPVQNVSRKSSLRLSDFDGKNIGMQPGVADWEEWVAENLPHSKVQYYNTYPDLAFALKTHKISGFLVDSPVLALMSAEDNSITAVDEPVGKPFGYSFFYAKTEAGKKLCDEMSEYIRKIKASGELDEILSKWQGADEAAKIPPDFKNLPAKNGTLTYAAEATYPPFTYYKGTDLAGIDIDIAVRFCREYGYGLNIQTMLFDAMIPAVNSGKVDFAGDFTPSEEHEEAVYFSEPYCIAHSVMACLKDEDSNVLNVDSLAGKRIAVQTGTTCAELVPEKIPSAELAYFNSLTDQLAALRAGKVDAVCCSLPAAIFTENADPSLMRIDPPLRETYLYPIFAGTEKGRKLCEEYSAFLKTLWDNGTIDALNEKWLGSDESKKVTEDYSALTLTNGTVIMAVDTSLVPFAYVKDNRITGYDIDLAVMFCRSKGYALEIQNMPLTGVIASVKAGKSDFTQSLNKTPERSENTLFTSTPAIKSGNVLLKKKTQNTKQYTVNISLSEFDGKKIGIHTGSNSEFVTAERIPSAKLVYYDSQANMIEALRQGKIDAMSCGEASAIYLAEENDDLALVSEPLRKTYRSVAFVSSDKGLKLRDEWGEFLKTLGDNGTISKLFDKWILNNGESSKSEDFSELPSINGTLKMAADVALIPFVYVKDNRIQGYDIDLAVMFCKSKGYGLEIIQLTHSGILAALASGKCDFSYAMEYTEERAKSVLFSEVPNIETANVLVVLKPSEKKLSASESVSHVSHVSHEEKPSFWEDIALSFKKTFIREDRWKLFAEGIMNTMIMTVSSVFCGMLLGFAAFMACRKGNKISNAITKFSVWLIKGTPIVVLLMILYYVIFGHVNISGIIVAIIAFTLTFGTSVYRMLTFGTGAVDKGQTEASYALGFTDMQTFFTVILPQAALHFMPSFREEVTMLIKSTSVVGYIAVQDLTKMGDIVRSRTYEAFFPLIAVAVIYFILAGLLNIIVTFIEFQITPSRRKPEDILHGIDTARGNENHD